MTFAEISQNPQISFSVQLMILFFISNNHQIFIAANLRGTWATSIKKMLLAMKTLPKLCACFALS
eukprot:UN02452